MQSGRRRRVTGSDGTVVHGLEGAPPPRRHIWVSRVKRGDASVLNNFIMKRQIKVFYIEKVSHDNAKFNSFKISIAKNDVPNVLKDSFWPASVQCQIWRGPAKRDGTERPRVVSEDDNNNDNDDNERPRVVSEDDNNNDNDDDNETHNASSGT